MSVPWSQYKVRDVCTLINGRAYSKPELLPEGKYPVLRVGNFFTNNHWYYSDMELGADKYCDNGDLLYAWSASFGPRIWAGEKVIYHYHIWKVLPAPELIDKMFLFMWFLWDTERIKQDQGTGTTMIHVAKGSMEDRDIWIPALPEQVRIARILDKGFAHIGMAEANVGRNVKNARALFESHLQTAFTQGCTEWVSEPLANLATFRNGINYTKGSSGERIKIVGVKNFRDSFAAPLDGLEEVTIDGELSDADTLRQDDILVVRSNGNVELIGRCLFVGEVKERISHSGFTIRIRLADGKVFPRYLCHFMKSAGSRRRFSDAGTGTNIKSLNQGMLAALAIPVPPIAMQRALVARLDELSEDTRRLESLYARKSVSLQALKRSLLHEAFTGKL